MYECSGKMEANCALLFACRCHSVRAGVDTEFVFTLISAYWKVLSGNSTVFSPANYMKSILRSYVTRTAHGYQGR
uniref:Uncharacterized protein n=1 Tax=Trichuris muris TaxID=70415 RepID=A0A5S6R151_TRIMR